MLWPTSSYKCWPFTPFWEVGSLDYGPCKGVLQVTILDMNESVTPNCWQMSLKIYKHEIVKLDCHLVYDSIINVAW